MLEVGIKAPDFELPDQNGKIHRLSDYAGKKVILYFYPKDNTAGCTKQACGFSERYPQFMEKGVVILGVSKDSVASHKRFEEKYGLAFTLLADPERKVIEAYDVWKEKKNYGKVSMGVVIKSGRRMILKTCLRNWHNEDYIFIDRRLFQNDKQVEIFRYASFVWNNLRNSI
jgi:thioredoxin-dependent peroxiredoxin